MDIGKIKLINIEKIILIYGITKNIVISMETMGQPQALSLFNI